MLVVVVVGVGVVVCPMFEGAIKKSMLAHVHVHTSRQNQGGGQAAFVSLTDLFTRLIAAIYLPAVNSSFCALPNGEKADKILIGQAER